MQGALQNLAAVIAMRTNVGRMNEDSGRSPQTGSEQLTNQGCDIVFDHVGFAYNSGETGAAGCLLYRKAGEVTAHGGPHPAAARPPFPGWQLLVPWDYQKGRITVGGMDVSKSTRKTG